MFVQLKKQKKAAASVDKESGKFTSLDKKSAIIKERDEGYSTGDTSINHPLVKKYFADNLKVYQHIGNNQENGKTKETPGGQEFAYSLSSNHHALYTDVKMTLDNIKTLVFSYGREVTLYWGLWSGTGKFTKEITTVPLHQAFYCSGDIIVSYHMIFDYSPFSKEVAAAQKNSFHV